MFWGRSKSTVIEEGRGKGVIEKQTKMNSGRWGPSMFAKKNAEIFKMKFYSYFPVFSIDYNSSMKY